LAEPKLSLLPDGLASALFLLPTAVRPVVEPLSHAGTEFLHQPFDVAESRLCLSDQRGNSAWT